MLHIMITNAQGDVVKDEYIHVVAKDENLYYIGDLGCGEYVISFETIEFVMIGNFDVK